MAEPVKCDYPSCNRSESRCGTCDQRSDKDERQLPRRTDELLAKLNETPECQMAFVLRHLINLCATLENELIEEGKNMLRWRAAYGTSRRDLFATIDKLLAEKTDAVPECGRRSALAVSLKELRDRWAEIVREKNFGDQLDGDFTTLDEIHAHLTGEENCIPDGTPLSTSGSIPAEVCRKYAEECRANAKGEVSHDVADMFNDMAMAADRIAERIATALSARPFSKEETK